MTIKNEDATLNAAISAGNVLKEAHASLTARKAALLDEQSKLKQRIMELRRMPLLRSEALEVILKEIDRKGEIFPAQAKWAGVFGDFAFPKGPRPSIDPEWKATARADGPLSLSDLDRAAGPIFHHDNVGDFVTGSLGVKVPDEARFYFFFGDIIKAKVKAYFESLCPPLDRSGASEREGVTVEMKREEIAEKQGRLTVIAEEVEAITAKITQIEEAGVQKPLLHSYR